MVSNELTPLLMDRMLVKAFSKYRPPQILAIEAEIATELRVIELRKSMDDLKTTDALEVGSKLSELYQERRYLYWLWLNDQI